MNQVTKIAVATTLSLGTLLGATAGQVQSMQMHMPQRNSKHLITHITAYLTSKGIKL